MKHHSFHGSLNNNCVRHLTWGDSGATGWDFFSRSFYRLLLESDTTGFAFWKDHSGCPMGNGLEGQEWKPV